jgi:phenylacetate-coenzyme A ligase PaaK-like adenylate-forming protein
MVLAAPPESVRVPKPIEFFKSERIICGNKKPQVVFTSSGTTGVETSRHYVTDISLYEESFMRGFEYFYETPKNYCVLALLPSYLERENSSLIYMVKKLIEDSRHPQSGFFLHNIEELVKTLLDIQSKNQPVIFISVTFALLDLAENYHLSFPELIVMETGGMKGRRKEISRQELHRILSKKFGVEHIHSEYGMTELLSQAYSKGGGIFHTPPWMRILVRDINNPFFYLSERAQGGVNVIDLANQNSCSFIETQDLGRLFSDGSFEVLGRMDKSQLRGCNMLM